MTITRTFSENLNISSIAIDKHIRKDNNYSVALVDNLIFQKRVCAMKDLQCRIWSNFVSPRDTDPF